MDRNGRTGQADGRSKKASGMGKTSVDMHVMSITTTAPEVKKKSRDEIKINARCYNTMVRISMGLDDPECPGIQIKNFEMRAIVLPSCGTG